MGNVYLAELVRVLRALLSVREELDRRRPGEDVSSALLQADVLLARLRRMYRDVTEVWDVLDELNEAGHLDGPPDVAGSVAGVRRRRAEEWEWLTEPRCSVKVVKDSTKGLHHEHRPRRRHPPG